MLLKDFFEGTINRNQALDILQLPPDFSHDDIIQNHRRLMLKYHPDRGGNSQLASKLNQARDLLQNNSFKPQQNHNTSNHDIFRDNLQKLGAKPFRRNVFILPIKNDFLNISSSGFGHQPLWKIKLGKFNDGQLLGAFNPTQHTLNMLHKAKLLDKHSVQQLLNKNRIAVNEVV